MPLACTGKVWFTDVEATYITKVSRATTQATLNMFRSLRRCSHAQQHLVTGNPKIYRSCGFLEGDIVQRRQ